MEPLHESGESRAEETPSAANKSRPTETTTIRWLEWFPPSVRVGLVLAVLLIALTVVLIVQYSRYQVLTAVSRVRRDMRSMATGIEAYSVDNAWYPAHTGIRELMIGIDDVPAEIAFGTTFRRYLGRFEAMTLTTPVAYLTDYPLDPFAEPVAAPFRYYATLDNVGWILASFGPDADWREGGDIEFDNATIATVYVPRFATPSSTLLTGAGRRGAYTYDPTNGLFSHGDVWRIKQ